jgi:glycerol-3-phosphate dehydrogenase
MKIAILGAGAFGTALGGILANKGYDIDYYDSKVERERLSDVLMKAKYVVLCVPSIAVPYLLPYLPKNLPLIVATKGILTDYAFHEFRDWMVLSGPGFADDIKAKKKTFLTATDSRVVDLFSTDYVQFDFSPNDNVSIASNPLPSQEHKKHPSGYFAFHRYRRQCVCHHS